MVMINWSQDYASSNSVCNHTRDWQVGLLSLQSSDSSCNHSFNYRPNWTPPCPITIINYLKNSTCKRFSTITFLRFRFSFSLRLSSFQSIIVVEPVLPVNNEQRSLATNSYSLFHLHSRLSLLPLFSEAKKCFVMHLFGHPDDCLSN